MYTNHYFFNLAIIRNVLWFKMVEFIRKRRKIILIVLIVLFIELSGYGILASLSRLLSAL